MNLETYCRNRGVELWQVIAAVAWRFKESNGKRTYPAQWLADNIFNGYTRPEHKSHDEVLSACRIRPQLPQCVHREALLYLGELGLIRQKEAA